MRNNTTLDQPVQLILPLGRDVKKSNIIVRTRVRYKCKSVYSCRILAGLISCIRTDDTDFAESYSINVRDIIVSTNNNDEYTRIKEICSDLIHLDVEVSTYNTETKETELIFINFFERVHYNEGIITSIFTRSIGPYLLQLRGEFTTYKLIEYLRLSTVYSQRIFEILKSWSGKQEPVRIMIDDLHEMLDTPPSFRSNFKNFRTKILEKVHTEITTKTELRYQWRPLKKGGEKSKTGKVYAIEFLIRHKQITKRKTEGINNRLYRLACECAGRVGGGICYEDNETDVCSICNKHCICRGIKKR